MLKYCHKEIILVCKEIEVKEGVLNIEYKVCLLVYRGDNHVYLVQRSQNKIVIIDKESCGLNNLNSSN